MIYDDLVQIDVVEMLKLEAERMELAKFVATVKDDHREAPAAPNWPNSRNYRKQQRAAKKRRNSYR